MRLNYVQFRDAFVGQGIFSTDHIRLRYPDFNSDNLLHWQKKGYIVKLRNKWYCFSECINTAGFHYLIANTIYRPSYISHQEALAFYGLIPESIKDSISVTTKKTMSFHVMNRTFKYYSIHPRYFFGYELKEMDAGEYKRNFMMASREKAILDLFYLYSFYKTDDDIAEIRFNEGVLEDEVDWDRMAEYLERFNIKTLEKKIMLLKEIYHL